MGFLLLFVSLIFSGIFYLFFLLSNGKNIFGESLIINYKLESFSSNLFLESIVFTIIGFIFFIYFSKIKILTGNSISLNINFEKIGYYAKIFFQKYLYYIGFIFFYISIYLIFKNYDFIKVSYIIFIINILILVFFFLTNRFFIFKDFIKINTIIFSLTYIFFYIYILIIKNNFLQYVDFINSIFILIFFIISLSSNKFLLQNKQKDKTLISYFFLYLFILSSFYLNYIFESISFIFSLIGFLFSILIFNFFIKLEFFNDSKKTLKTIGLFSLYISSIFGIIYILKYNFHFIVFFALIYSIVFNLIFHKKFENYISLFFVFLNLIFLIYFIFFEYFYIGSNKEIYFLIISFIISFLIILYTYFFKLNYIYTYYFYHIISYIVNVYGVSYFFFLDNFNILNLAIILFIESIFVFLSYYKISTIKNIKG